MCVCVIIPIVVSSHVITVVNSLHTWLAILSRSIKNHFALSLHAPHRVASGICSPRRSVRPPPLQKRRKNLSNAYPSRGKTDSITYRVSVCGPILKFYLPFRFLLFCTSLPYLSAEMAWQWGFRKRLWLESRYRHPTKWL